MTYFITFKELNNVEDDLTCHLLANFLRHGGKINDEMHKQNQ